MSNKHDANVQKSTLVNFQIGLIASLLFTYVMFEVYTSSQIIVPNSPVENPYTITEYTMGDFIIEKVPEKPLESKPKPQKVMDISEAKIVDDNTKIKSFEKEFESSPPVETAPVNPDDIENIEPVDDPVSVPFSVVEDVPVFPGCEHLTSNKEKAECFSAKIRKIVSRRFNTEVGERYGLSGMQRIFTLFEVSPNGVIQNIQIRAPHPGLEKEARRVIGLFPDVTPGKQRGRAVTVKYQLPITFRVQE
ncbi:energy transducer TonB [Aquimarina sp. 2201CG1-2-11]|uniref:energy transducer TonB n=1 Tax=Aquimarina discodermiae TaxID=3231043 RepID=UPI00346228DB